MDGPLDLNAAQYLRKLIRERMNEVTDNLVTGSASNFPDYRHEVGVIEGLAWAERELLDLVERIEAA
jgi:hypothetical protein|tara:strand:- start:1354 stop:1554 length:201 start_codon:yes stop_codon:yes gene_type:complete